MHRNDSMASDCRVLLAGGTPSTRGALRTLLSTASGLEIVGEAVGTDDLYASVVERVPDFVLLDTQLPDPAAVLASRELREQVPACEIALLTTFADARAVIAVAFARATGHITKTLDPAVLAGSMLAAHRLGAGESLPIGDCLLRWFEARAAAHRNEVMRVHDRTLLQMLVTGATHAQMATRMRVDTTTLRSEIAHLYVTLSEEAMLGRSGVRLSRLLT